MSKRKKATAETDMKKYILSRKTSRSFTFKDDCISMLLVPLVLQFPLEYFIKNEKEGWGQKRIIECFRQDFAYDRLGGSLVENVTEKQGDESLDKRRSEQKQGYGENVAFENGAPEHAHHKCTRHIGKGEETEGGI